MVLWLFDQTDHFPVGSLMAYSAAVEKLFITAAVLGLRYVLLGVHWLGGRVPLGACLLTFENGLVTWGFPLNFDVTVLVNGSLTLSFPSPFPWWGCLLLWLATFELRNFLVMFFEHGACQVLGAFDPCEPPFKGFRKVQLYSGKL
jgi:hypothetical protein